MGNVIDSELIFFFFFAGKKETEHCKQQLIASKRHAESIAVITEDLAQEFLEV